MLNYNRLQMQIQKVAGLLFLILRTDFFHLFQNQSKISSAFQFFWKFVFCAITREKFSGFKFFKNDVFGHFLENFKR